MASLVPCVKCGKGVNTPKNPAPVCQECRRKARMIRCAWCGREFDNYHQGKKRNSCSPGCGRYMTMFTRFGWTKGMVAVVAVEAGYVK